MRRRRRRVTCLGVAAEGLGSHQVGLGLEPQLVGLEAVAEPQSADIYTDTHARIKCFMGMCIYCINKC